MNGFPEKLIPRKYKICCSLLLLVSHHYRLSKKKRRSLVYLFFLFFSFKIINNSHVMAVPFMNGNWISLTLTTGRYCHRLLYCITNNVKQPPFSDQEFQMSAPVLPAFVVSKYVLNLFSLLYHYSVCNIWYHFLNSIFIFVTGLNGTLKYFHLLIVVTCSISYDSPIPVENIPLPTKALSLSLSNNIWKVPVFD